MSKRTIDDVENDEYCSYNNLEKLHSKNYKLYENYSNILLLDNHIYFYNIINADNINKLIEYLTILNSNIHLFENDKYIYLHIDCTGGIFKDLLPVIDNIQKSSVQIISIIENDITDCAFILSSICTSRFIKKNASIILNPLSGYLWNYFPQCENVATDILNFKTLLYKVICNIINSKITNEKLEQYFARKNIWNCKKCKKLGLVDEII
tara:strand:+ start:1700 stop:2326 length:627 start_codon:yes stop_codon:yes gene_type:complete